MQGATVAAGQVTKQGSADLCESLSDCGCQVYLWGRGDQGWQLLQDEQETGQQPFVYGLDVLSITP